MSASEVPNFQSFPMDTLEATKSYLVVGPNGSQIRLTSSAYQLLEAVKAGTTFEDLAKQINCARGEPAVSKEQLEQAYNELVRNLRSIDDKSKRFRLPWAFWIRFRLIPEKWVARVSPVLSNLYCPYISIALLIGVAGSFFTMFYRGIRLDLNDSSFLWGYVLYLCSLFVHEFGHSSACARYGAQPSDIGFTIYLIYPAFYSDVSSAWQLRRWQRVIVDLGGNYFQFLMGSCFIVAFYGTHWEAFRLAVVMIISTAVFSLNPIFKFDGYWVLADLLGVTNLASQPARIGKYFCNRLLKRPVKALPWPTTITTVLIVYSLVTMVVWTMFLRNVLPMLWHRTTELGHNFNNIRMHLVKDHLLPMIELRTFLISMFFLIISLVMIAQLAKRLADAGVRWSSSFSEKFFKRENLAPPESVRPVRGESK